MLHRASPPLVASLLDRLDRLHRWRQRLVADRLPIPFVAASYEKERTELRGAILAHGLMGLAQDLPPPLPKFSFPDHWQTPL